jgi:hypothetical protein
MLGLAREGVALPSAVGGGGEGERGKPLARSGWRSGSGIGRSKRFPARRLCTRRVNLPAARLMLNVARFLQDRGVSPTTASRELGEIDAARLKLWGCGRSRQRRRHRERRADIMASRNATTLASCSRCPVPCVRPRLGPTQDPTSQYGSGHASRHLQEGHFPVGLFPRSFLPMRAARKHEKLRA